MTLIGTLPRRMATLIVLIAGALLLEACSFGDSLEPEPTATPTAVTFNPGDVAVGTLVDDAHPAWEVVDAWTAETRGDTSATEGGISSTTTVTVILPDQRHVLTMNGETVVTEEIVLDGTIYMRGTLVSSAIYPAVDAESWISFSPDQVPEDSVLAQEVAYLTAPPAYPLGDFTEETRALPASPSGEVRVDDRTCEAWTFTTSTPDAPGIDYTLAFDAENRPCKLVRESGGVVETTTWSYPASPEPITAPQEATPVESFPDQPS
jgi:hypothetical protein